MAGHNIEHQSTVILVFFYRIWAEWNFTGISRRSGFFRKSRFVNKDHDTEWGSSSRACIQALYTILVYFFFSAQRNLAPSASNVSRFGR